MSTLPEDEKSEKDMPLKFEAVGLSKEQAQRVADELCGSAVWHVGHAWVSNTCVVRPQGCQCPYCHQLQNETVVRGERIK
jgi:hypothetical protein